MDEAAVEEYPQKAKDDPRFLIYAQVERAARAYSDGMNAQDALAVLEAYLQPYKDIDKEWAKAYEKMSENGQDNFVPRLRACVVLMGKMNLWPPRPRTIRRGEELLQGL